MSADTVGESVGARSRPTADAHGLIWRGGQRSDERMLVLVRQGKFELPEPAMAAGANRSARCQLSFFLFPFLGGLMVQIAKAKVLTVGHRWVANPTANVVLAAFQDVRREFGLVPERRAPNIAPGCKFFCLKSALSIVGQGTCTRARGEGRGA